MKTISTVTILILALMLASPSRVMAQKSSKMDTVKIMTSAECDMCKTKIEKEVGLSKGVKKVTLDVPSKVLTVIYNPAKTDRGKLRTVVSNSGYDADEVKANNRAQRKLPDCCQPGAAANGKCDTLPK